MNVLTDLLSGWRLAALSVWLAWLAGASAPSVRPISERTNERNERTNDERRRVVAGANQPTPTDRPTDRNEARSLRNPRPRVQKVREMSVAITNGIN